MHYPSIYVFVILVHVSTLHLWLLLTRNHLGEHMFSRTYNFIIFRIACPALATKETNHSHWLVENASQRNSTALTYDTDVIIKCTTGYHLPTGSVTGNPNITQKVKCGSNADWTPAPVDCSLISMNVFENYLTSFPVVKHPLDIKKTFIAC